jgi:ribonucleoside-diphosphate reductase alpha chain
MAEAVARARSTIATTEATARSGSGNGKSKRSSARAAMDKEFRFTGAASRGLTFERRWTTPDVHPYDEVAWELRDASIANEAGKSVFEQKDVEVPVAWSQLATNVVVSKYFRGHIGTPGRERSVKQLIDRVVNTITSWAATQRYFATDEDLATFKAELTHLLLHQKMAFNSPVWFNVGVEPRPQCSACFINSVQDSMSSIMDLAKTEAMLFKYGSGAGVNLSTIRGSKEKMSGGGIASGPVSFMKGFDAFAGVVKSGGKTRRAAKMVILDSDHPDVLDFVDSKANEERKAWALIEAGYDPSFTGEAYASVFFQNANHSVRASDDFMTAVETDSDWTTREVTTHDPAGTYKARTIFRHMAEAAWICGDPGIQYDTTINDWNPVANSDRQYATNPCSEFSFLNDTSCNLASLNLMKFVDADGSFDAEGFRYAARLTITAQEVLVDNASYPTPQIEENSHRFRPLGLGFANLGALLMSRGLAYDSDAGRAYAAAITAIMTGEAYRQSAIVARDHGGAFNDYAINEGPFLRVIGKHRDAAHELDESVAPTGLVKQARATWDEALALGEKHGYRNAQVSVLAPTGTIAFMMDCDTTGIEPDIALIKYKKLVGEGFLKIVNGTVPQALQRLGYTPDEVESIVAYIDEFETIEGAPDLKVEHLPVFDCAFKPVNGERSIHHMGHLRMMSATQPFLSGANRKTGNMPDRASAEDSV